MKKLTLCLILLFSLSVVFATEEQVFAAVDAIVKNPPATQEVCEKILMENGFIPLPPEQRSSALAQNYFGDTEVIAYYTNNVKFVISFNLHPFTNKDFTTAAQKVLKYFTNKYEYTYLGYDEETLEHKYDFSQEKIIFDIRYKANERINIFLTTRTTKNMP